MTPNQRTIANDQLLPVVGELLREGNEVTLRAKGRSMMPYIRDLRDNLILRACPPDQLAVGDAVLAFTTDKRYVGHRIIAIDGDMLTLKGDGNLRGTEQCRRDEVLGRLTHVERNGKRIDCNTPAERRKAAIGRTLWRAYLTVRHALGTVVRAITGRKRH